MIQYAKKDEAEYFNQLLGNYETINQIFRYLEAKNFREYYLNYLINFPYSKDTDDYFPKKLIEEIVNDHSFYQFNFDNKMYFNHFLMEMMRIKPAIYQENFLGNHIKLINLIGDEDFLKTFTSFMNESSSLDFSKDYMLNPEYMDDLILRALKLDRSVDFFIKIKDFITNIKDKVNKYHFELLTSSFYLHYFNHEKKEELDKLGLLTGVIEESDIERFKPKNNNNGQLFSINYLNKITIDHRFKVIDSITKKRRLTEILLSEKNNLRDKAYYQCLSCIIYSLADDGVSSKFDYQQKELDFFIRHVDLFKSIDPEIVASLFTDKFSKLIHLFLHYQNHKALTIEEIDLNFLVNEMEKYVKDMNFSEIFYLLETSFLLVQSQFPDITKDDFHQYLYEKKFFGFQSKLDDGTFFYEDYHLIENTLILMKNESNKNRLDEIIFPYFIKQFDKQKDFYVGFFELPKTGITMMIQIFLLAQREPGYVYSFYECKDKEKLSFGKYRYDTLRPGFITAMELMGWNQEQYEQFMKIHSLVGNDFQNLFTVAEKISQHAQQPENHVPLEIN